MKSFDVFLTEPQTEKKSNTNESVTVLLASSLLAFACAPLFGSAFKGVGGLFSSWFGDDEDDSKDSKDSKNNKDSKSEKSSDNKKDDDSGSKLSNEHFAFLLDQSKKANEKEKDEATKKKNEAMLGLLCSCSYDKDGNEIPMDQRLEKMKDMMPEEQFEAFKQDMQDTYEKSKNDPKIIKAMEDASKKAKDLTPEDYEKMINDAKATAKTTLETIEKEKAEIEENEKKLKEIEDKLKEATGKEKEKLQQQAQQAQQALQQAQNNSITAVGTGTTPAGEPTEPTKPTKKPEDYTDDEIDAMQEELTNLDPEKDKDKIKEKEDLLKSIATAKGKDESEFVPKVDTGEDGTVYQHKVGPLGGKYKRPKKDDGSWGKWVSESMKNMSLTDFLYERLGL